MVLDYASGTKQAVFGLKFVPYISLQPDRKVSLHSCVEKINVILRETIYV